jgi:alkylation response protein AidB-like acyl-CoA dehydrogenase
MIKVLAPNMACQVIDWAMQVHGGGGVSDDFGLANAYAHQRTLRFARYSVAGALASAFGSLAAGLPWISGRTGILDPVAPPTANAVPVAGPAAPVTSAPPVRVG